MLWIILYMISVPACCVMVLSYLNRPYYPPLYGVYAQENKLYRIKFLFIYCLMSFRQLVKRFKRSQAVNSGASCDGTVRVHRDDELLEQKFFLSDYPNGIDAVYFNGVSEDEAFICALARRPGHVCDTFMYIKLKDQDLLLSVNLPDTYYEQDGREADDYAARGLRIHNFIPMRTWNVTYDGEMKYRNDPDKKAIVKVKLTWSAMWSPFNYDFEMSARSMARDMARETWSRVYFKQLEKIHQSHYEQMGSIKGTITVNDAAHYVRIPCVRDHTFGKFRDWRTFHRYVLHFMFLQNGDSIAVGAVSQPAVLSHLTIGYVCLKEDQSVVAVDSCDFKLYQHGEDQNMPKDYGFTFKAGGIQYAVHIKVEEQDQFYIGKQRVAKFYERWADVTVNGVRGRACLEWHYNNVKGNKKTK